MKFTLPKGMRDVEPDEMSRREYAFEIIKGVLVRYGFRLVEPSALENLETLTAKSGPDIENELYAFEDKSKRKIGLRFDLTVGMARMVAAGEWAKPIRLACISNMWRYDNPQYARYRSFYQWDAEIYGSAEPAADAEIISMIADILGRFDLDFEIRISNRKLIEGVLMGLGVRKERLADVLRIIDKISKTGEGETIAELAKCGIDSDTAGEMLVLFKSVTSIEKIKPPLLKNNMALEGLAELETLFTLLKAYKIYERCRLDLSVVRGIDYYTGIVYEAWVNGEEDIGAIAGGGRYDDLLGIYGKPMPATGIAGGIERLLLSLEKCKLLPQLPKQKFFLAYATPDVFFQALEIMRRARESGLSVIMDINKRNLSKQFEYAGKLGAEYVLVVGKKELDSGKLRLRDMKTGGEKDVTLEELGRL